MVMTTPIPFKVMRSKDEAIDAAHQWMRLHHGQARVDVPAWYYERLGFLIDCMTDLHTPTFTAFPQGESA